MSISPIDTITYIYVMSSYFSTSADSKGKLEELLREYNLTPSGDSALDVSRLQYAIKMQEVINAQQENENETQGAITDRPWIEIMWELGLEPNEDIQEDYDDLIEELTYRINNAQDEAEYNKYLNMYNEVQDDFNNYSLGENSYSSVHDSTLIGLSQLALMNKMSAL